MKTRATIPGRVLEVRYLRSTDGHRYKHEFTTPVRMVANRDGSVTLRGPRRIWADDSRPGFGRYVRAAERHTRARRNPIFARSTSSNIGHFLVFILAATVVGRLIDSRLGEVQQP